MDRIDIIQQYIEECIGDPSYDTRKTAVEIDALYQEKEHNLEPSWFHRQNVLGVDK